MSPALIRGLVVVRGGRHGVVWGVSGESVVLLPVLVPRRSWRGDVALETWDLVVCGVMLPGAVIRTRPNHPISSRGCRVTGEVPGQVMCRVVLGVIRSHQEAVVHERWTMDKRHRENADDRCVKIVG